MGLCDIPERWNASAADINCIRTPGLKWTPLHDINQTGELPLNGFQSGTHWLSYIRKRLQQPSGIGMTAMIEYVFFSAFLHYFPSIHNSHTVTKPCSYSKIMRNQHHRHAISYVYVLYQVQYPGLYSDIQ